MAPPAGSAGAGEQAAVGGSGVVFEDMPRSVDCDGKALLVQATMVEYEIDNVGDEDTLPPFNPEAPGYVVNILRKKIHRCSAIGRHRLACGTTLPARPQYVEAVPAFGVTLCSRNGCF